MADNKAPGYAEKPEHRVDLVREGKRVKVSVNGDVIADSQDVVTVEETGHKPVFYIPRSDVKMDRLVRTEHHTYCPFKGTASYYSIANGIENAVWTYETPFDEAMGIKEYVAFYPNRVDSITAE